MVKENIESAAKNEKFDNLVNPALPKNMAGVLKPDKAFLIKNQKPRFGKWIFIFYFYIFSTFI